MKRNRKDIIAWLEEPLTDKEKHEFSRTHPQAGLAFRLRYPNFSFAFSVTVSIMSVVISIVTIYIMPNIER